MKGIIFVAALCCPLAPIAELHGNVSGKCSECGELISSPSERQSQ